MKSLVLVFLAGSVGLSAGDCGEIYKDGISEEGKKVVVDMHNKYRKMIANGVVPKQPRGIDLLRMRYDEELERGARQCSMKCKFEHFVVDDARFKYVGQNILIQSSNTNECSQNWTMAVEEWFNEHVHFDYENIVFDDTVGHFTQVVWADSYLVGCDFICYYDNVYNPLVPYQRLYTCNYAPAGNCAREAPYEIGIGGCEDLC